MRIDSTPSPSPLPCCRSIILWNTRYLERAIVMLRQAEDVPDHLLPISRRSAGSTST